VSGLASLARFGYAVLLRTLLAVGGAIAGYGATGMFTSGGIFPPNAIVIAGLVACGAAALALWSSERTLAGIWPALLIVAVPFSLYAIGSLGQDDCPQPHPPITQLYGCAVVGTHALAVIAPAVTLIGLATLALDLRTLTRGRGAAPTGS
jgi:hypothetical protein